VSCNINFLIDKMTCVVYGPISLSFFLYSPSLLPLLSVCLCVCVEVKSYCPLRNSSLEGKSIMVLTDWASLKAGVSEPISAANRNATPLLLPVVCIGLLRYYRGAGEIECGVGFGSV
jgi:hypothetical protein